MAKISVRVTKNITLVLCYLVTMSLTACTLFIDEEDLPEELPTYEGKGYDKEVHEVGDFYDITYQYKSSTIVLNADHELTKHIVKVESNEDAGLHVIYFDGSTPDDLLPRPLQGILSNNLTLFEYGLCDKVYLVEKEGGQTKVTCKHVDVRELFESLDFSMQVPFDDYVQAYDLCDDEGNVVAHIENGEVVESKLAGLEQAESKPTGPRKDPTVDGKDGGLDFYIPFGVPRNFAQAKGFGDNAEIDVTGGFGMKLFLDVDFSWDNGFTFEAKAKDGEFTIGYKVKITKSPKDIIMVFGSNDILNGRFKIPLGPTGITVVPVFGISFNLNFEAGIETSFTYNKTFDFRLGFDGEDFFNESHTSEGEYKVDFEAYGMIQFPIIKISLGFGIGTNAITFRIELYLTLETKLTISSAQLNLTTGKTDIQTNPKIDINLKIGFAIALVAEGRIIASILNKAKSYIKDKLAKLKKVENGVGSAAATVAQTALVKYLQTFEDPNVKVEYSSAEAAFLQELLATLPADQLDPENVKSLIQEQLHSHLSSVPETDQINESAAQSVEDTKEAALRLGPLYPEILQFPVYNNYLFPKMKEGSLRVGRKWNADQTQLVFLPEFTLETPGILSLARDFYPGFLIKLGSEEIMFMPANNSEKLTFKTPKGKVFKAEIPSLEADYSYTLVPCYATTSGGNPSIFDKSITFSATTPSLSITDLTVTKNDYVIEYDENINPTDVLYTYKFDTYTSVVGSRNVSEWGIIDLNDNNANTRVHTSKSSTLQSGRYIHHWSVKNTRKSKILIRLQPYIFAKDNNKSDWSEAKFFAEYNQTIQSEYDFSDSKENSYVPAWQQPEYTLQLDSVSFEPDNYAEY